MLSRLTFLITLFSILSCNEMTTSDSVNYLITGTYTGGMSEGIYVFEFNSLDGSFKEVSHVKTSNPSYLTVSPDEKFVFSVNENSKNDNGGEVSSFSFNKSTGILTPINSQLSGGDSPCYIDEDKTGKWLAVGNYSSGTFSVLPVNPSGEIAIATTIIQHTGTGVNKQRQEKPHVHCTIFSRDNKWLFVSDLGTDKVMIYDFNAATGEVKPGPQSFAKITDGGGPRHLVFHPNNKYAYLVEEMGGAVDAFNYIDGKLDLIQHITSIQSTDTGFIGSADIHISPDGKFLYASNRGGFNTIAIYKINPDDGNLTAIGHQPSLGEIPRGFTLDPSGNYLLAGNQESNNIVIFKRDATTGLLTDTGKRIDVGKPICLKWISRK